MLTVRPLRTLGAMRRAFKNWPLCGVAALAVNHLQAKGLKIKWSTRGGTMICAPPGDGGWTAVEVYAQDCYGLNALLHGVHHPRIIDIGANIGSFSLTVVEKFDARVLAFEPAPKAFAYLRHNTKVNHCDAQINSVRAAVVGKCGNGKAELYERSYSSDRSSFYFDSAVDGSAGCWISVPTVSLDAVLSREPATVDLLKMDIEGSEYEVLLNTSPANLKKVSAIVLEYHPMKPQTEGDLKICLAAAGFSMTRHVRLAPGLGILWFLNESVN